MPIPPDAQRPDLCGRGVVFQELIITLLVALSRSSGGGHRPWIAIHDSARALANYAYPSNPSSKLIQSAPSLSDWPVS